MSHTKRSSRPTLRNMPGAPPGIITPDASAAATHIRVIAYDRREILIEQDVDIDRIAELRETWSVVWINVVGLGNAERLRRLQELFSLHPLVIEDVVHVCQRPKIEEYEDYDFIVLRLVNLEHETYTSQLSIVFKGNCVLTFQERPGPYLEPVRDRLQRSIGRIRSSKADYLTYALIDTVIDYYMPVVDEYGNRIEGLEQDILAYPDPTLVIRIRDIKHELQEIRRAIRPVHDVVGRLYNEEVPQFTEEVRPYLRDCMDHVVRLTEAIDDHREAANDLMGLHMSNMSQRMNEIMKVLTMIATIFIPLSFIAGIYGMNFDPGTSPWNMPELRWYLGYPFALGIMGVVVVGLLIYFRHKGWLGGDKRK